MLYIYQNVVSAVSEYVHGKWPEKEVMCQENEAAWHKNRYIIITTCLDSAIIHYEYVNGYLELHLEGDYYGNPYCQSLYKYLRSTIETNSEYRWHRWFGMAQGRLRLERKIENELELGDAITKMIGYIEPILLDFKKRYEDGEESQDEQEVADEIAESEEIEETDSEAELVTDKGEVLQTVVLETLELNNLIELDLRIPQYQRIYCWPQKNVELLLDDILTPRNHKYHLGTIILQKKENGYDIIDGQQRLVTLALILRNLGCTDIKLLNEKFDSVEAQKYIGYNRFIIDSYLNRFIPKEDWMTAAKNILSTIRFDVLILNDSSLDLAYTFFSTQNSRGKALTDYELLKSHHLRYIPEVYETQQKHLAKRWDDLLVSSERESGDRSLSILLGIYTYCIRKWSRQKYWYIKEANRVKNEFEAAPTIPEIPPFGERFDFMDPIQGGSHFFAYVDNFIHYYHQFTQTVQYRILRETISCSGLIADSEDDRKVECKKRTHWWYGDVIACFLFAYYLKFGNQYMSETLTCITRIISQIRYEKSKANKQSLMDKACDSGIMQMLNQATSPTFFLAELRNVIKGLPFFDQNIKYIREDYFKLEMALYKRNSKYYQVDFKMQHNR